MGSGRVACWVVVLSVLVAACGGAGPGVPDHVPTTTGTGDAFEGVKCSAVRPTTEPDLMGWDPGSRADLSMLQSQGVVVVRYKAQGCNVELEVLSNCIGATGKYGYSAYAATDTKIAHNTQELYAELPIGAARLGGKLKGGRSLRTDYTLVGMRALPIGAAYSAADLRGPECDRATHVVSRVYLGAFAMVAGETSVIDAAANVFSAKAGGVHEGAAEHIAREGLAAACEKAQIEGTESAQCAVPLRIGLLAIAGRADGGCPTGSSFDGKQCVQHQVITAIDCPPGTKLAGDRCVGTVSTSCAAGLHFEAGRGCVPDVTAPSASAAELQRMQDTSIAPDPSTVVTIHDDPSRTDGAFDKQAASAEVRAITVEACKKPNGPKGTGHVTLTFGPTGAVIEVVVEQGPFAGTSVGGCVAARFRAARIPPFAGDPVRVRKSFTIE